MKTISTQDNFIDSRNVDKRIDELEGELEARHEQWQADMVDGNDDISDDVAQFSHIDARTPFKEWVEAIADGDEDAAEYLEWVIAREEAQSITSEWQYGAMLIRADYFRKYAEEYARDIGAVDNDMTWPHNHIDWEEAADELRTDYGAFDIGDVEYLVR